MTYKKPTTEAEKQTACEASKAVVASCCFLSTRSALASHAA